MNALAVVGHVLPLGLPDGFMTTTHPSSQADPTDGKAPAAEEARHAEIPPDVYCQECGYQLRGLTGDRCPECGRSLEGIRSQSPRIPWVRRRKIGRFRAYWKTVWFVMFRQRQFCEEMARPVSYPDARRFQWVTVLHAYLPVLAATIALYLAYPPTGQAFDAGQYWRTTFTAPPPPPFMYMARTEVWPVAVMHICFFLFLVAASGVPSYFLHPRSIPVPFQNRAIALSYYVCAPLACAVFPVLLLWVIIHIVGLVVTLGSLYPFLLRDLEEIPGAAWLVLLAPAICVMWLVWWAALIRFARRTMRQVSGRGALVAVGVPLLWLLLGGLILVGLPFLLVYVLVVLFSVW